MAITIGTPGIVAAAYGLASEAGQGQGQQLADQLQYRYNALGAQVRLTREGRAAQIYAQNLGHQQNLERMQFGAGLEQQQFNQRLAGQDWLAEQQQGREAELLTQRAELAAEADQRNHELQLERQAEVFGQQDKMQRLSSELDLKGRIDWAKFSLDYPRQHRAEELDRQMTALDEAHEQGDITPDQYADLQTRHRRKMLEFATGLDPAPTLAEDWEREHIEVGPEGSKLPMVRGKDGEWQVPRGWQPDTNAQTLAARHFEMQMEAYYDRQVKQAELAAKLQLANEQAVANGVGTGLTEEQILGRVRILLPDLPMPQPGGTPPTGAAQPGAPAVPGAPTAPALPQPAPPAVAQPGAPIAPPAMPIATALEGELRQGQAGHALLTVAQTVQDVAPLWPQAGDDLQSLQGLVREPAEEGWGPTIAGAAAASYAVIPGAQLAAGALFDAGKAWWQGEAEPAWTDESPEWKQSEGARQRLVNLTSTIHQPRPVPAANEQPQVGMVYGPFTQAGHQVTAVWTGNEFKPIGLWGEK